MTPNTLIGRTFGSLTQGEREGLPCGTVLREPNCPAYGRPLDYYDVVKRPDGEWWYARTNDPTRMAVTAFVVHSIPTTPDPDEAKAREARDPRTNPRPGDVFRQVTEIIAKDFAVVHALPDGRIVIVVTETYPDQPTWEPDYNALIWDSASWTRRFRGAEMLRVAKDSALLDAERALVAGVRGQG